MKNQAAKRRLFAPVKNFWQVSIWHKFVVIFITLFLLVFGGMYGIATWYKASESGKPLKLGVTFIPAYAESLGVNDRETMDALIDDLGVRHFRLVSYWNQLEPENDKYDFELLDWQFEKAEAAGAKVSLSIGLRQPRWPECHMPEWAKQLPDGQWQKELKLFMTEVINRYKDSPALDTYQLENEFFLKGFGTCTDFDRQRLIDEFNLVKSLDPEHTVIISRSNNALGLPVGQPRPDEFGIAIYKRVWDDKTNRYLEYPYPAWYYGFLAGAQKILLDRNMIIHELQAEAWPPNAQTIAETPLEEQSKSIDAGRLRGRFEHGIDTGMREIYMWGAEYWYYRWKVLDDPSLWDVAKEELSK